MPYRDAAHRCLSCDTALEHTRSEHCSYETCPRCGGNWIAERPFLWMLRATPTAQRPDVLLEHNDGSPRRRCLHCGELMNIVWIDWLQLDRCEPHGIWLDPGELERALHSRTDMPKISDEHEARMKG